MSPVTTNNCLLQKTVQKPFLEVKTKTRIYKYNLTLLCNLVDANVHFTYSNLINVHKVFDVFFPK